MRQKYTGRTEFLERVKKPECPSISVLSEELKIPKTTLYAWMYLDKKKGGLQGMKRKNKSRTPISKFSLLAGSEGLKGKALQDFCDEKGVSLEELLSWRDLALGAIEHSESGAVVSKKEHDLEIAKLDKELKRKNEALAEAAALLVLQKKISDIFQDEK